jgi:cytidylate kinase
LKDIIVAIDGYSGCGKSSTAKAVAKELGYRYIDSGAMYRAVTLYLYLHKINHQDSSKLEKALNDIHIDFRFNSEKQMSETYLNGKNVEDEIRKMYISKEVSAVSAIPVVRKEMVAQQRRMGNDKAVVMDGRDIGTVVFPEAELKIFMTSDFEVRAVRRKKELDAKGENFSVEEIAENLKNRDRIDSTRKESPLRKAEGAIEIDTTHVTLREQTEQVLNLATAKIVEVNKR